MFNLKSNTPFNVFYEVLFLSFIFLLFPMLGMDADSRLQWRLYLGWGIVAIFFIFFLKEIRRDFIRKPYVYILLLFLIFQLIRAVVGWTHNMGYMKLSSVDPFSETFVKGGIYWFLCIGLFFISYFYFATKRRMTHLIWVLSFGGFFLAVNALPNLLMREEMFYTQAGGDKTFFYPALYFSDFVFTFILGKDAHPNYVGDIIALGVFSALALCANLTIQWFSKDAMIRSHEEFPLLRASTAAVVFGMSALCVFLFMSRGTILFFGLALIFFMLMFMLKGTFKKQLIYAIVVIGIVMGFFLSFGDFGSIWEEMQTIESEIDSENSSLALNKEAARRAVSIFKANPVLGTGVGGYVRESSKYADPKTADAFILADFESMCFYLHLLAEEGIGAFLFFLFLIFYAIEVIRGLFKTQSRYKFLVALSLFSWVLMVLGHVMIHYAMQRLSLALLVYITMGASLAALNLLPQQNDKLSA